MGRTVLQRHIPWGKVTQAPKTEIRSPSKAQKHCTLALLLG